MVLTWLGLTLMRPAYASGIESHHQITVSWFHPTKVSDPLPKAQREQLKLAFITDGLIPLKSEAKSYLESQQANIDALRRSISANPSNIAAWNNLGHELFSLKHYREALAIYNHTLTINPDYSLGLANRCGVLSKLGHYTQALASCDLALRGDGNWGIQGPELAWDNRGDVLFNLKRYSESLLSFQQALTINASYQNAQLNRIIVLNHLAQILYQEGRDDRV